MQDGPIKISGHKIDISNTDKVFFPKDKITKGDVLDYYSEIADIILPHLKDRPMVLHRYPDGIKDEGFIQQDMPDYFPSWIHKKTVSKEGGKVTHAVCDNKAALMYLVDQAVLVPHIWLSRKQKVRYPDKMIFDLDPSGKDADQVRVGALKVKEILDDLKLKSFVMTSGSKGYHIVVPLDTKMNFDKVREVAKGIAQYAVSQFSDIFTTEMRKNKRGKKIFVDYLRNAYAQTSVAPYAIRAMQGAPVATPLEWKEMNSKLIHPQKYNKKNILRRVRQKGDPWKNIYKVKQSLKGLEVRVKN